MLRLKDSASSDYVVGDLDLGLDLITPRVAAAGTIAVTRQGVLTHDAARTWTERRAARLLLSKLLRMVQLLLLRAMPSCPGA